MNFAHTHGLSARFIYRVIRKRAPLFAVVFALLFTIIAVAQYLFVRHGVYKSAQHQSRQWADQVADEIGYKGKWDLSAYRQSADVRAPSTLVFTSDGIVIETKGFIPGLIGQVRLLDNSVFDGPKTVNVADTGETWRQLAVKLAGGFVVLGILNFRDINAPDDLLKNTARKFGSTIEEALKVRTGQTSAEVDYAIIDNSGKLLFAAEGLPLKVNPDSVAGLANSRGLIRRGDKLYLLFSRSIVDSRGNAAGTIVIPRDVSGEERVIRQQIVFNALTASVSWLAALLVVVLYLAVEDWQHRPQPASLEEALKDGESQSIEFKGGHADVPLQRVIAAFANTNSGTIFLGVDDSGAVVGIDGDSPKKKDEALQRIRNITTQAIKPAISVSVDFILHQGRTLMRIFVPRGEQPLYFVEHEIYVREQSASMKATPEQVERILAKFYG